jgi:uncharacterized OB-fold protein
MMETREFTSASFNKFLSEKRLMASQCSKCKAMYLPPRPLCIRCYDGEMEWVELKGKGTLVAYTVIAVGPTFMIEEGYDRKNHYCSGIVQLEEGPRMSARIIGVDVKKPDTIKIGTPLEVDFLERGEGENKKTFLAFKERG